MPNKIYAHGETAIIFGSEAGDDVAWSTENIADGAGRQSAHHDLGDIATARAVDFMYRFWTQLQATPTVGRTVQLYFKTSDGTHHDNDDGTGDVAVSAEDKLSNLDPGRPVVVDEAAANVEMVSHGLIQLHHRYVATVLWDDSGASITNDAAETKAELTPVPPEIQ